MKRVKAAALKYSPKEDVAPKLVAKGEGHIAKRIVEIAEQNGITIKEDPNLLEVLAKLDLYEEIPEKLYSAVAVILSELYLINKKV